LQTRRRGILVTNEDERGLIDGYWLFVNPVILGQGIPLFTGSKDKIKLKLLTTHQFTSGVTELNYTVVL